MTGLLDEERAREKAEEKYLQRKYEEYTLMEQQTFGSVNPVVIPGPSPKKTSLNQKYFRNKLHETQSKFEITGSESQRKELNEASRTISEYINIQSSSTLNDD